MFKARLRKYWCDYISDYVEISRSSVEEILEYLYEVHKESVYPNASSFCCGIGMSGNGYAEANCSLQRKGGYRGSMWLEKITYTGNGNETIIFSKYDGYISPKTMKIFEEFSKTAKQRGENKNFGDF